jgi:hypothetical protein
MTDEEVERAAADAINWRLAEDSDSCLVPTDLKARVARAIREAVAAANGRWTSERPKVAGWYWVRGVPHVEEPEPALVSVWGDHISACLARWEDGEMLENSYFADAEWCGPIRPPQEGQ